MYLFCLFFACKQEKKESVGSTSVEQEPSAEQNLGTEWVANSLQEELGFDMLEWNEHLYIKSARYSRAIVAWGESGREELASGLGVSDIKFLYDDTLYAHAFIERIQDKNGNILREGIFGKIAAVSKASGIISGNSVLRNGSVFRVDKLKILQSHGIVGRSYQIKYR